MKRRVPAVILGAALLFGLAADCAVLAQEHNPKQDQEQEEDKTPESGALNRERESAQFVSHLSLPMSPPASLSPVAPKTTSNQLAKVRDRTLRGLTGRFLYDQKEIWASPAHLRIEDADWLLPLAGLGAALFATDASFNKSESHASVTMQHYKTISTAGLGVLAGAAGGMWLLSYDPHSAERAHWRETGLLAGESALNSLLMTEALKYSLRRQRPDQGAGNGPFFERGGTSFPSEHAAAAWSIAGVVAHEYPGPLTKMAAYGLATLVSVSRVRAGQHFPSDVFIGSLAGYMISQSIYSRHASPDLPGAYWPTFRQSVRTTDGTSVRSTFLENAPLEDTGSAYVPLDSWVYPAFERLEALGYIQTAFEGTRPWARSECARLISEANDKLAALSAGKSTVSSEQAELLLVALSIEFHREKELEAGGGANRSAALQSTYLRVISASGTVLTDGYHFGETYGYDYGRPFRRGTNFISGVSADFTSGRVFLHLSGEFQHAASAPPLSDSVRDAIASVDKVPVSPAQPFPAINQVAVMDSYLGFNLDNLQISFGRQSLSWGPGPGGSLILSDNAPPFYLLRVAEVQPLELPSFLGVLGPMRFESFAGREQGHPISGHPFIYGQKVSLKPFQSFEFAYARTTTIAGIGDPLNTRTLLESVFGRLDSKENSVPGDSHTSIDWIWHVPHMKDRFILYGEMESDDDPIPLQNLTRAVMRPGIFLVRLPGLDKWDLHAEWTSSVCPGERDDHGELNYWNYHYRDGYTNDGNLVGNTVGREGKTIQVWTRYWIAPHHTLDFSAKNSEVDTDFIPGGGKWQDYRVTHEMALHSGVFLRSFLQFEHIANFHALFAGARNNATASLEFGFAPGLSH
jgi:membrane-associated phospholipid phosphatase